ncbi:MAG: cyclic lactone autoinducer peptide [Anaerocolumna sp.]
MNGHRKQLIASLMEKVARKTVEVAADTRCMYIFHQPKQPDSMKRFKK